MDLLVQPSHVVVRQSVYIWHKYNLSNCSIVYDLSVPKQRRDFDIVRISAYVDIVRSHVTEVHEVNTVEMPTMLLMMMMTMMIVDVYYSYSYCSFYSIFSSHFSMMGLCSYSIDVYVCVSLYQWWKIVINLSL